MSTSKATIVTGWVLVVLLAAGFLVASMGKLTGNMASMFEAWGYPAWFAMFIGIAELAGAIGLLIPKTARLAILGLTALMIGAAYTHVAAGEGLAVLRPAIFAALLWTVWRLRGYSLSNSN